MKKKFAEIESATSPILRTLGLNDEEVVNISDEDREKIALFIGFSFTRVPSFRNPIHDLHKFAAEHILDHLIQNNSLPPPPSGITPEQMIVEVKSFVSLPIMIEQACKIADSILLKDWQFFKANSKRSFITSDNPVFFSNGGSQFIGPIHPKSEIIFPIRKDLLLVCTHKGMDKTVFFPNDKK
ncbi:DUF4238 domain-containing protein [Bdellovibrio sp. HCB185ZH]|uniref:DUF4238 domain-containing protein n=1 Tax=Bdellovibrio sp. HCB185ZH TaxID=3394235 RepID=UPI0039A531E4